MFAGGLLTRAAASKWLIVHRSGVFLNEITRIRQIKLAAVFIPKCTALTYTERIEMWVKCGMVVKAGEEALKAKDRAALEDLRNKATANTVLEIDRMITQLQKGR